MGQSSGKKEIPTIFQTYNTLTSKDVLLADKNAILDLGLNCNFSIISGNIFTVAISWGIKKNSPLGPIIKYRLVT